MPQNLTDNGASYPSPVVAPANGDLVDVNVGVVPGMQVLANRTAYLKAAADYLDPNLGGARRIRYVETFAALRALSGMSNREVAAVVGYGLYQWISESSVSEQQPNYIVPNGSPSTGRWLRLGFSSQDVAYGAAGLNGSLKVPTARLETNTANGVAGLDSGAKVPVANMRNAIVTTAAAWQTGGAYSITGSASVPTTAIAISLTAGDIVILDATAVVQPDPAWMPGVWLYINSSVQGLSQVKAYVESGPTTTLFSTSYPHWGTASVHSKYTAASTATHTFYVYASGIYPSTTVGFSVIDSHLRAVQIRP